RLFNPADGVIATANNKIVDSLYPRYLSRYFEPPYRVRRIEELLAVREKHSPDDITAIQMDTVSLHARTVIDILRDDLTNIESGNSLVPEAARHLLDWDGNCSESSVTAAIFHVFHHRLLSNLLVGTLGEQLFLAYTEMLNQCLVPTDNIFKNQNSLWFQARPRSTLVAQALNETCKILTAKFGAKMECWQWGRLHSMLFSHPFGRTSFLQPLLAIGPLPAAGDGTTINLGFYRHSNPYQQTVGVSLRFLVDLKQPNNTGFVLPSGQSGHPLSEHFADQTALWLGGRRIRISSDPSPEKAPSLVLESQ
ncbi:MAG TPA: penicillin acylase family protein, partial [Candidatus Saccharimonadales bacterium]|nr:penicillin acylase family protein [Candidatus Saccharimonadales bacterium]